MSAAMTQQMTNAKQHNCSATQVYTHNPYDAAHNAALYAAMQASRRAQESRSATESETEEHAAAAAVADGAWSGAFTAPGAHVLRHCLVSRCAYVGFPAHTSGSEPRRLSAPYPRPAGVVQMFLGQVPFRITDGELLYMFSVLAGVDVLYVERIVQGDSNKGCIQLFVHEETAEHAQRMIHKRVLFDQGGFWYATSAEERALLESQCAAQGGPKHKGLPYNSVVLERSTSTFALSVAMRAAQKAAQRGQRI